MIFKMKQENALRKQLTSTVSFKLRKTTGLICVKQSTKNALSNLLELDLNPKIINSSYSD